MVNAVLYYIKIFASWADYLKGYQKIEKNNGRKWYGQNE